MADEFIDIASIDELPVGRAKTVAAGGRTIALYHTAGGFFASDNSCPHRGGPLGAGDLMGSEIVCPWHLWGFDVTSGLCTGNPSISINTHEVKIEGSRVLVRLAPVRQAAELP